MRMKTMCFMLIVIFVSAVLFPFISCAADVKALIKERDSLMVAMNSLKTEFDLNEAKRPSLEQRKSDLDWTAGKVEKEVNKWNAVNATLKAKVANHAAAIISHNGRCGGTYESQSYVDQCNSAAATLNARKATLDTEVQYNDTQRDSVQGLLNNQAVQERNLRTAINAYNAHRDELIAGGLKIEGRLREIEADLGSCRVAIRAYDASTDPMKDGTMERVKAICGPGMFDGS